MVLTLANLSAGLIQNRTVAEIERCNTFTARFSLTLSHCDAIELVETQARALKNNGRIEFSGGVIIKLISQFYDSPYVNRDNYTETLHDLLETFYYFKNETGDLISDDNLIEYMKERFNDHNQGSVELLGQDLVYLVRQVRCGCAAENSAGIMRLAEEENGADSD